MTTFHKKILAAVCALFVLSFGGYKFYGYFQEKRFQHAVTSIAMIQLEEFMLDKMPSGYKNITDIKTDTLAATREMTEVTLADRMLLPDGNTLVETVTTTLDPVFLVDLAQHILDKKTKGQAPDTTEEYWAFIKGLHQDKEVRQYLRARFTMQKINGEWRRIR
ncbi:hypothetical protein [Bdellovibrio sp. NC01]|uniref:hypothetical protein n=1 Tax=Bdellovibrio sp. NC01 TaxID=2220073 RepID=UPI00115B9E15|nr:hypothetical protein [Bdellovibrio sp. NC01]QDK38439.1 hypothetical protein DOE51_13060 [Bdellovibrio sp. NC01]